jgi:hypothetical protein
MSEHAAGYSFGPATVDVETDTAGASRWLREFLTPWVETTAFGTGNVLVRFACSGAAFDALKQRPASAERPIPCFALDRQIVTLPGWDDGEALVLADVNPGCFYRIQDRRVDIVGRAGEDFRPRLGLMRVVRELLAARKLGSRRLLDLHAAAFETQRRAVLLAGPKLSGKTTLLCYALASGHARLIANDRVFVEIDREPANVYGLPTIVSVRPDTLRCFPGLRGGPDNPSTLFHAGEPEPVEEAAAPLRRDVQSLSPGQLAVRLGSSCVSEAPLACIAFPEITTGVDSWSVEELSAADGLALLKACVYGGRQEDPVRTVFGELAGRALHTSANSAATADDLTRRVRFFRCRLGPHAYERDAHEWLEAIGLGAGG